MMMHYNDKDGDRCMVTVMMIHNRHTKGS